MLGRGASCLFQKAANLSRSIMLTEALHTVPKKRFYKSVSVVQSNGKFELNLGTKGGLNLCVSYAERYCLRR